MAIKFGEIDATQILDNEYRIGVLEQVISIMMQRAPAAAPTIGEMTQIKNLVVRRLQVKYPNSGIGLNPPAEAAKK